MGRTHVPTPSLQLSEKDLDAIFDAFPVGSGVVRKIVGRTASTAAKILPKIRQKLFKRLEELTEGRLTRFMDDTTFVEDVRKLSVGPAGTKRRAALNSATERFVKNRQKITQMTKEIRLVTKDIRGLDLFKTTGKRGPLGTGPLSLVDQLADSFK